MSAREGVTSLGNNVKIVKDGVVRMGRGSLEKWIGDGDLLVISRSIDGVIHHMAEIWYNVDWVVLGNLENRRGDPIDYFEIVKENI